MGNYSEVWSSLFLFPWFHFSPLHIGLSLLYSTLDGGELKEDFRDASALLKGLRYFQASEGKRAPRVQLFLLSESNKSKTWLTRGA